MKRIYQFDQQGSSSIEGLILIAVVIFSIFIAGGLFFTNVFMKAPLPNPLAVCCDNADCSPIKTKTITFSSPTSLTYPQYKNVPVQYDLLKSNSSIFQCFKHSADSGQVATYPDGPHPIIMSTSQELAGGPGECRTPGYDQLADWSSGTKQCLPIPDDELIYVCVANCMKPFGNTPSDNSCDPTAKVYGNSTSRFDIYFRDPDYPTPGVPNAIKNCLAANGITITPPAPNLSPTGGPQRGNESNAILQITPFPSHETLQLHTFDFTQGGAAVGFPRPFCKPALYLYPQVSEPINVKINPKGKLNTTIPVYPQTGWNILGNPNGTITYEHTQYDYLYYEAAIPNSLIPKENTGYNVAYKDLKNFFSTLLPKLGLNANEQKQFSDYWLTALPYSPYYIISLVPQQVLNDISPLTISPTPDTLLRVTLNFQPVNTPQTIDLPILPKIQRTGFVAVEWAGMFQQDKDHPFTCLE